MAKTFHRLTIVALLLSAACAFADPARFDLTGPKIDVRVTRDGAALPISMVPNLQEGDQLWLHADLPPTQSVHYLLVAVFLRGTTNPPPDNWFIRIQTWDKKVKDEGVTITVPKDAQQALLLLAPETGGDFSTLRSAVKGRPGIFVRASQDLTEAGFEQARIEKYLAEMKNVPPGDEKALADHSNLLARTLNLKPNPDCFKKPVDQQYNCLTQTGTQTLLDDGHGQSIVTALSNGPGSDFINQASYTQMAGAGVYSAYVGAIVDLVRLTSTLHTAQYQYIPAIAFPEHESLNLRLNAAPSFHNPKSVIVIGLPGVQKAVLPPLRPTDPKHISCLLDTKMVLPVEGAPLVFSTAFAHDLALHIEPQNVAKGEPTDIPLYPDAFRGGLAILPTDDKARRELPNPDAKKQPDMPNLLGAPEYKQSQPEAKPVTIHIDGQPEPKPASDMTDAKKPEISSAPPGVVVQATVQGKWGFDNFTGPVLNVQRVPGEGWKIVPTPQTPAVLIVGQPNHLLLTSTGTACIQSIGVEPGDLKAEWKLATPTLVDSAKEPPPATNEAQPVDLTLNLQHAATPGTIQLAIQQFGQPKPDQLGTKTFSEPAKIESVRMHAGDVSAALTGTSLDQVKEVVLNSLKLEPVDASAGSSTGSLTVTLPKDAKVPPFKAGEKLTAKVELRDGRTLEAPVIIEASRPSVTILSRRIQPPAQAAPSPITLASPDDLPLGDQLVFFLKSPSSFPRNEQIEVANADDSLHTSLSVGAGSLILQDAHTILATLDPLKTFGTSAFGPLRLRAVTNDGTGGEWLPLATMVRLPTLDQLHCATDVTKPCQLSGSSLYLIDSVSADPAFTQPAPVPEGFVDQMLPVPHPTAGLLYLKLRDDPEKVQQVNLPILPLPTDPTAAKHGTTKAANPTTASTAKPDTK
ncbi:hypothetical protein SAMN05421770_102118 [Granulicella rosea]|uniref:Uncharacterized protein n=1 Tax=Granulicella rosea TaxID=474952 RepID=A0A239GWI0_9BACT|nr:hypothetical protein [Granulicella rosea]SNS73569.1 hypothetical protein SAMN05421770_102118 [Granulicella rosea]